MPIQSEHPQYVGKIGVWYMIDNVLKGHAKQYIPDIEPIYERGHPLYDINNVSRYHIARNSCQLYRERAIFTNFAAQTLEAVVGLALGSPPTLQDLPDELEYLETDCTGNKLSLDQLKQTLVKAVASIGRIGLFTDYPSVAPGLSKATQAELQLAPRMFAFPAEAIDNWDTDYINGVEVLTMVKIRKQVRIDIPNDPFMHKYHIAYLVLQLDQDGYYMQSTIDQDGQYIVAPFYPMAAGKKLTKIPFTFIGSENNDSNVDSCPLESIVELNIGHLRNSAIYEDNLVKYGRGTLYITSSLPSEDWQEYYENRPIVLGTEEGYFLGSSGSMNVVQLQPAQEAAAAMNQKQEQMLLNGAHLITTNTTNISAETTALNMADQLSVVNTVVGNIEDALNEHIGYCAMFLGLAPQDGDYINLSKEFIKQAANPLIMAQILAAINGGALPSRVLLQYYQNVGIIAPSEDLDEMQTEADNENPFANMPAPTKPADNSNVSMAQPGDNTSVY
jgi:hypothetical protein